MSSVITANLGDASLVTQADDEESSLDDKVLDALRNGGPRAAIAVLETKCGERIHRYCCQLMGNKTAADDAYQRTFLEALCDIAKYDIRSFRAWLFTIAHNRCIDELRRIHRDEYKFIFCEPLTNVTDTASNAEEVLEFNEFTIALDDCLERLTPGARIAVILRYQEGFTYSQMADICRVQESALRVRVARAVEALRQCLKAKGFL